MKNFLKAFLPHLAISMLLGLLVLVLLDSRNPLMKFLNSEASYYYIVITCLLCIGVIGTFIIQQRKKH